MLNLKEKLVFILILFATFNLKGQCTCSGTSITLTNPDLNGTSGNMPNSTAPTSWTGILTTDLGVSTSTIDCISGILTSSCNGGAFSRIIATSGGSQEGISQTISGLTIGHSYNVTFSQALVLHWGRSTGHFDVTFCGTTIAGSDLSLPGCDPCQTAWETITVGPFTATATSHTLQFLAVSDGNGTGGAILPLGICTYNHSPTSVDLQLDGISICRVIPLPVELSEFNVELKEKYVELTWSTSSEINNNYFIVERSSNGDSWNALQRIEGEGNSNQETTYGYIDEIPLLDVSYYRLKQVDIDGSYSYSEIKAISNKGRKTEVFPNPFENEVALVGKFAGHEEIFIYNILGQNISNLVEKTIQSENKIVLEFSNMQNGVYLIRTKNEIIKIYKDN